MLRIRANGWTMAELAKTLDCSIDTIDAATNAKGMLNFESIARLGFHFPDEFALIEALWNCRAVSPPTLADRLDRIERELGEVRKVIA